MTDIINEGLEEVSLYIESRISNYDIPMPIIETTHNEENYYYYNAKFPTTYGEKVLNFRYSDCGPIEINMRNTGKWQGLFSGEEESRFFWMSLLDWPFSEELANQ